MIWGTLTDACGDPPGAVCEWVYERSGGNESLAELADWFIDRPLQILLIVAVGWVAARFARRWIRRGVHEVVARDRQQAVRGLSRIGVRPRTEPPPEVVDPRAETRAHAISQLMSSTATAIIWSIIVLMVVGRLGLDLGPLVAGAGIIGVALGFGTQTLVKDWVAGVFMTLEDHYGIGDVVDLGEATGVVERITLRATVLRGVDGTVWHVPNGQVVRVGNLSQLWSVALLDVTVGYDVDVERAETLLRDAANEVCGREAHAASILEPPEVLGVEALGVEGVTLRLRVKVKPGSQWELQRALRAAVKESFVANRMAIAPPRPTPIVRVEPAGSEHDPSED